MKPAYLVILLASLSLPVLSNAAWQRLGTVEKPPIDIASSAIDGVEVVSTEGVAQPENLLADDAGSTSKVSIGKSQVVYALGEQDSINVVGLCNDGAEGKVVVLVSADGKAWESVTESVFTSADRNIMMRFANASAGYVKLQFELNKSGTLRQLSIYGSRTQDDFDAQNASVNAASGIGGAKVIYCHPSPIGGEEFAMKFNRFDFPESDEKYRTLIYDLGKPSLLTEVGSVHSPRPVRFTAYAFETLPEKEDWRHRMSFDPSVFDTAKPVAVVEDSSGLGYTKAKLTKSITARYLALRWEPDFNPPSFVVSSINIPVGSGGKAKTSAAGRKGGGAGGGRGGNGAAAGGNGGGGGANGGAGGGGANGGGGAGGGGVGNFSSAFSVSAASSAGAISAAPSAATDATAATTGATAATAPTAAKRPPKSKK